MEMSDNLNNNVFGNLLHEIETAELKLKQISGGKTIEAGLKLSEEVNLLKNSNPEDDESGDSALEYFTAVGQLEQEVAELRKLSDITKLSVGSNKMTLDSLLSMVQDQKDVIQGKR